MALIIFAAFIVVYALLVISHKECNPRAYKLFIFGFLISVLYASVFAAVPDNLLIVILALTSFAILTQYFHWHAVETGRSKPMKNVVDITKPAEKVLVKGKSSKSAKVKTKATKRRSRK